MMTFFIVIIPSCVVTKRIDCNIVSTIVIMRYARRVDLIDMMSHIYFTILTNVTIVFSCLTELLFIEIFYSWLIFIRFFRNIYFCNVEICFENCVILFVIVTLEICFRSVWNSYHRYWFLCALFIISYQFYYYENWTFKYYHTKITSCYEHINIINPIHNPITTKLFT